MSGKKKVFILSITALLALIFVVFNKVRVPYFYLPFPEYWSVEKLGFKEILEPDDFSLYYIDKIDGQGYDKKKIRYSALYQAYRESIPDSYVSTYALISLSGYPESVEGKMILQKFILDNYPEFKNNCYNAACGSGHSVSGVASRYARSLWKAGDYDGAFVVLKKMMLARSHELKPWLQYYNLEELSFILAHMDFDKKDIDFFDSELSRLKTLQESELLASRYQGLVVRQGELHSKLVDRSRQ